MKTIKMGEPVKDYDEYVVFLLASDNLIKNKIFDDQGNLLDYIKGMDGLYASCIDIARVFYCWDKNFPNKDLYSSLEQWISLNYDLIDRILQGGSADEELIDPNKGITVSSDAIFEVISQELKTFKSEMLAKPPEEIYKKAYMIDLYEKLKEYIALHNNEIDFELFDRNYPIGSIVEHLQECGEFDHSAREREAVFSYLDFRQETLEETERELNQKEGGSEL